MLGTATGIGIGGAAVAAGSGGIPALSTGIMVAFAVAGSGMLVALALTSRLPGGCLLAAQAEPELVAT